MKLKKQKNGNKKENLKNLGFHGISTTQLHAKACVGVIKIHNKRSMFKNRMI